MSSLDADEPVFVHLTVCKTHVRDARRWLQLKTSEPVDTFGTEFFMQQLEEIQKQMHPTPVYRMTRTG